MLVYWHLCKDEGIELDELRIVAFHEEIRGPHNEFVVEKRDTQVVKMFDERRSKIEQLLAPLLAEAEDKKRSNVAAFLRERMGQKLPTCLTPAPPMMSRPDLPKQSTGAKRAVRPLNSSTSSNAMRQLPMAFQPPPSARPWWQNAAKENNPPSKRHQRAATTDRRPQQYGLFGARFPPPWTGK